MADQAVQNPFQTIPKVKCALCGYEDYNLRDHILEVHDLEDDEYLDSHPGHVIADVSFFRSFNASRTTPKRDHPPAPTELVTTFGGHNIPVNGDVPESACLTLPPHYRFPKYGQLAKKMRDALISLIQRRATYIYGIQGSGKDAFFHAYAALTRTPSDIYSIIPGVNINSWINTRGFHGEDTVWEEGKLLRQLRDGFVTRSGRRIPYMILITDFDRADPKQQEILRLIMDSTEGRIVTGDGETHKVFPGTVICCTANTAGSGDPRGRSTSAQPIDSAIMDRFKRKYKFPWMDWRDEELICRAKFPTLWEKAPELFATMGQIVNRLRGEIEKGDLYCELSHRAVCDWLEHAQDIIEVTGKQPAKLLQRAKECVFDGFPDDDVRAKADKLIDPLLTGGAIAGVQSAEEQNEDLDSLL